MTNPILEMLQGNRTTETNNSKTTNATSNPIQDLLRSNNPQEFVTNMLYKNPNAGAVMDSIRQNGGSPKQAFYAMAKAKGIDPEAFLSNLH